MLSTSNYWLKLSRCLSSYCKCLLGEIEVFWPDIWRPYLSFILWFSAFFLSQPFFSTQPTPTLVGNTCVSESSCHLQIKIHKHSNVASNSPSQVPLQLFVDHSQVSWFGGRLIPKRSMSDKDDHFFAGGRCTLYFFSSLLFKVIPTSPLRLQLP